MREDGIWGTDAYAEWVEENRAAAYRMERETPAAGPESIVQAGYTGMIGSLLAARGFRKELVSRYPEEFIDGCEAFAQELSLREAARIAAEQGAVQVFPVLEGGIFGALWELGESRGSGMELRLSELLLRQETIEICEYFDLSPYCLFAGGCALIVTERPAELTEAYEMAGIPAAVIGRLAEGNGRVLRRHGDVRYLEPVRRDELAKLAGRDGYKAP